MPTATPPRAGRITGGALGGAAGIAIAMGVMNVTTYGFQMVAARVLGPADYGAISGLMALLLVLSVAQLALQATAARRIAADPSRAADVEGAMLTVTYRAALALGAIALLSAPLVWWLLRLDGIVPALLLALTAVPLTIMGGQCGILQGERRWLPLAAVYLAMGCSRLIIGGAFVVLWPGETSAMAGVLVALWVPVLVGRRALGPARSPGPGRAISPRSVVAETSASSLTLLAFFALSNIDIVIARAVLDSHEAGLYAGGLIVAKAALFLPQFLVVLLFPSMSSGSAEKAIGVEPARSRPLLLGLSVIVAIGVVTSAGTYLLRDIATTFIGGAEYQQITDRLWIFAVIGAALSALQLLAYSTIARRGRDTTVVLWIGFVALIGIGITAADPTALALTALAVDAGAIVVLLATRLLRRRAADAPSV